MLCQKCKKNIATIFIDAVINDKSLKGVLCEECASNQFKLNVDGSVNDGTGNFAHIPSAICKKCNTALSKIISTQRFGCARCYEIFGDYLLKNKTSVVDASPKKEKKSRATKGEARDKSEILKELEQKLAECIEKEKYEEAAVLRDEVKKIKNS